MMAIVLLYVLVVCRSWCLCVVVDGDRVGVLVVLCGCFLCGVGGDDVTVALL